MYRVITKNSGFNPQIKKCKTYSEALAYKQEYGGIMYELIGSYDGRD